MNQTPNYALNQWEASDQLRRVDVNADNAKIDAALKAEANARANAVNAINATLSSMVRLKAGHYTGDGAATRTISVGFTPKAVFVITQNGYTFYDTGSRSAVYGGLAVTGYQVGTVEYPVLEVASGGFKAHYMADTSICANKPNTQYNYIALG